LKPFGDRGFNPAGIDIVILLFRKKKKGTEVPFLNYRFYVGLVANLILH
jgi:hypothetical protein